MVKRKDFNIQTNTQMDKQTNRRTNIEKQLIGQTGKMIDRQKQTKRHYQTNSKYLQTIMMLDSKRNIKNLLTNRNKKET